MVNIITSQGYIERAKEIILVHKPFNASVTHIGSKRCFHILIWQSTHNIFNLVQKPLVLIKKDPKSWKKSKNVPNLLLVIFFYVSNKKTLIQGWLQHLNGGFDFFRFGFTLFYTDALGCFPWSKKAMFGIKSVCKLL